MALGVYSGCSLEEEDEEEDEEEEGSVGDEAEVEETLELAPLVLLVA